LKDRHQACEIALLILGLELPLPSRYPALVISFDPAQGSSPMTNPQRIPLALKLAFTAFMAWLVPVYLKNYGWTNFLYFCDVAMILTLAAIWLESPLLASIPLVGIFLPQVLWVADFFFEMFGGHLTGLTGYMFDPQRDFFLRFLSFFHFWLPFLLLYLVWRLGYDRRAVVVWTVLAWGLMTVCYFFMPGPGPSDDPNVPRNINYVQGFSETEPQTLFANPHVYFALVMVLLPALVVLPTHVACVYLLEKKPEPAPAVAPGA
jgi:hypothetical protein